MLQGCPEPLKAVFVGLSSPAHGAPVIADALDILADDPDEAQRLREAAYEQAQDHYTPQAVASHILECLH